MLCYTNLPCPPCLYCIRSYVYMHRCTLCISITILLAKPQIIQHTYLVLLDYPQSYIVMHLLVQHAQLVFHTQLATQTIMPIFSIVYKAYFVYHIRIPAYSSIHTELLSLHTYLSECRPDYLPKACMPICSTCSCSYVAIPVQPVSSLLSI